MTQGKDTDRAVADIQWVVGADERRPRRKLVRPLAIATVVATAALVIMVGDRTRRAIAPLSRPIVAAAEQRQDRAVLPPPAPQPAPSPRPKVYAVVAPPRTLHPVREQPKLAVSIPHRPSPTPPKVEAVDGGNGAVAVHLTGEALRVALERDAALTKRLNEAELRRLPPARPDGV